MYNSIAIIGYSGHAYVVLDACRKANLTVKYYCEQYKVERNPFDLEYLGNESDKLFDWNKVDAFILGIGDNTIRQRVSDLIIAKGKTILNVIHPSAVIGEFVEMSYGIFVGANTTINTLSYIGCNCIINTNAVVEHDCILGSNVHIAPGVVLAGQVIIGDLSFIGANSVVIPSRKIGNNVIVGAGSVVLKDIKENQKWVGVPAKRIGDG